MFPHRFLGACAVVLGLSLAAGCSPSKTGGGSVVLCGRDDCPPAYHVDLDHDQRFVIPSNAEADDVVGEKRHNPNWRSTASPLFSLYDDAGGAIGISPDGIITVSDPTRLSVGEHTAIVVTHDGDYWDESTIRIEVIDAADCAFVDPSTSSGTPDGSRASPFASVTDAASSQKTNILLRRGTTEMRTTNFEPRNRTDLLIGAYGVGARPILEFNGAETGGKILSLSECERCEVRDVHARSGTSEAGMAFIAGHSPGSIFDNCVAEGAHYGFRVMEGAGGSRVLNSDVWNIPADGMYIQNAQDVEIGYNRVWDVAQNGEVDGDCVQFSNVGDDYNNTGWNVHHNKLDRTGTVGKFCLILGGNVFGEVGRVEYNWMIGDPAASGSGDNGSLGIGVFYLSPVQEIRITGNVFENTNNNGLFLSGSENISRIFVENNVFNNIGDVCISGPSNAETTLYVSHNLFYGCNYQETGDAAHNFHGAIVDFRNNISYSPWGGRAYAYGTVTEDYNLYSAGGLASYSANSREAEPVFVDEENGDFRLAPTSPGVNEGVPISEIALDKDGRVRSMGAAPDIGPYEIYEP